MNEEIANELHSRVERDQAVRSVVASSPERLDEMLSCDRENARWLRGVIRRHGWPGISMVGEAAEICAWVLAQHADKEIVFQHQCLQLLIEAADAHEAPVWQVAFLSDRVSMHAGQPQRYATQYRRLQGGWEPLPVEDLSGLRMRRLSLGLEAIDDCSPDAEMCNAGSRVVGQ
ncbi:DUF6624 domain-containing protein [Streptomyces aurantiacus]|uniref:Uncharacterized protein n=1 Tax=Streptomyces aurantiacus TaxID=47760 RepID=A0A7G1P9A6_9ACTN|nr:DUF6624 domain-containing protein [Streptomyces aurantiacus]BCL30474.1 hypothetical protein GCM10017557_53330 [Streptomyces aurantiacus]